MDASQKPQAALGDNVDPAPSKSTSIVIEDLLEREAAGLDLEPIGDAIGRHFEASGFDLGATLKDNYITEMGGDTLLDSVRVTQGRFRDMLGGDSIVASIKANEGRIAEALGGDLISEATRANIEALNIGGLGNKDLLAEFQNSSWFASNKAATDEALASLRAAGHFGGVDKVDTGIFAPAEPIALPSYEIPDFGPMTTNADIVDALEVQQGMLQAQHEAQLALIEEMRLGRESDAERWRQHQAERAADDKAAKLRFRIECFLILAVFVGSAYFTMRYSGAS